METTKSSGEEEVKGRELSWIRFSCFPRSHHGPWLVFLSHGKKKRTHVFYNIQLSRVYHRRIPLLRGKSCLLSSQGWLFVPRRREGDDYYYYLLNPATMQEITLPPLPRSYLGNWHFRFRLSSPPTGGSSVLFLFHCDLSFFVHCHIRDGRVSEDDQWVRQEYDSEEDGMELVHDVVVVAGNVYGITDGERFVEVDVGDPLHPRYTLTGNDTVQVPHMRYISFCRGLWLVESCGELFLVGKRYAGLRSYIVEGVEVYFSSMVWVKVRAIGDHRAFFLGEDCCLSFRAGGGGASGIKGNSIYFLGWRMTTLYRFDMALGTISVEPFCLRGKVSDGGQWLIPTSD